MLGFSPVSAYAISSISNNIIFECYPETFTLSLVNSKEYKSYAIFCDSGNISINGLHTYNSLYAIAEKIIFDLYPVAANTSKHYNGVSDFKDYIYDGNYSTLNKHISSNITQNNFAFAFNDAELKKYSNIKSDRYQFNLLLRDQTKYHKYYSTLEKNDFIQQPKIAIFGISAILEKNDFTHSVLDSSQIATRFSSLSELTISTNFYDIKAIKESTILLEADSYGISSYDVSNIKKSKIALGVGVIETSYSESQTSKAYLQTQTQNDFSVDFKNAGLAHIALLNSPPITYALTVMQAGISLSNGVPNVSFGLYGEDVNLFFNRKLNLTSSNYNYTFNNMYNYIDHEFKAASNTIQINPVDFKVDITANISTNAFNLDFNNASVYYNYKINSNKGNIIIQGMDFSSYLNRLLYVEENKFNINGKQIHTYRNIICDASYNQYEYSVRELHGFKNYTLLADTFGNIQTCETANLILDRIFQLEYFSDEYNLPDNTLSKNSVILAEPTNFNLDGVYSKTTKHKAILPNIGNVTLDVKNQSMDISSNLSNLEYELYGNTLDSNYERAILPYSEQIYIIGNDAYLNHSKNISAEVGEYKVNYNEAELSIEFTMPTSYILTGYEAFLYPNLQTYAINPDYIVYHYVRDKSVVYNFT